MRGLNLFRPQQPMGPQYAPQVAVPSAQQKMIHINRKIGNKGIQKQQGTTRILYDMLPLDGNTNFKFFETAQTRAFPFTNSGSFGNKLEVGESVSVERSYLAVATQDAGDPTEITAVLDLTTGGVPGLFASVISLEVANSQVLKPIPLSSFDTSFNKRAFNDESTIFHFDTNVIIPPLLEFAWILRTPPYTPIANAQLMFVFEGRGSIVNLRGTI